MNAPLGVELTELDTFGNGRKAVSWLQRLVDFPSEQTDLHERDPQILRFIRECAAPIIGEIGAAFRYDAMGNAIAELGPRSDDSLLFVAYAMTHPAARMEDPFAARIISTDRGAAVRGRGVAEQKSALAALLAAMDAVIKNNVLKRRLSVVLLTAGETGRHDAIASVLPELECQPRHAIVCIGTNNRIAIGNKGRVDFDVIVRGKTSHSSAPWNGINAIEGAQKVIPEFQNIRLDAPEHPKFGNATLTPTAIESFPKATHTVPDMVKITYDRRLLPGEDPMRAYEAICKAVTLPAPWKLDWQLGPVMYPNEIAPDGSFATLLNRAFEAAGKSAEQFYCNFALDAGYLANSGIEAVMLGPGEVDQFHSSEESVLISDLVEMSHVYYRIIQQCLELPQ